MQFTIRMSITVEVFHESAVLVAAAARALGEPWVTEEARTEATADALSSMQGALTALAVPEAVFERVPGVEVLGTTIDLPGRLDSDE